MKIILSRKGFDSSNGGQPSPILPDGTLLSLPIPYGNGIKFSDISYQDNSYLHLIQQLRPNANIKEGCSCHLDPDIRFEVKKRDRNWKGLFGQSQSAQSHLKNQKVGEGDIFLFFGWFKETEKMGNQYRYVKGSPDLHVIFGYLQIGKKYSEPTPKITDLYYHPHADFSEQNDCIYEASEHLSFDINKKGCGPLKFKEELVLTKKGKTRSCWDLPDFFKNLAISYHSGKSHKKDYFQSARIGQEFVIECNENIIDWAKKIISN